MNNISSISGFIGSDIVPATNDLLWNDVSELLVGLTIKPILVISNSIEQGSAEMQQLQKMLDACKLTPDQYNIVILRNGETAAWYQLREKLAPKIVFLIGILPAQLGISALFRLNEPNRFGDCIWLPSPSVKELEQNPEIKKQLWMNGMKPVFVDKKYGDF